MSDERHTVRQADGRLLDVLTTGPEDGFPLLFHNGTPCGLLGFASMTNEASSRGLRTVMYGRPGYGDSTPCPGRRVVDAAADVAAVLDALGAGPFVTVGWSGGGPHALACAARLPGRCLAAATMAGVAPYHAEGLDWLAGMGPENIEEFGAAVAGEPALAGYLAAAADGLAQISGEEVAAELGGLVEVADKAAITGEFADYLAASFRAALSGGVAGWRDDDIAFVSDWGFSLSEGFAVPVAVWQGDQDRMVPAAHGEWLARRIPGAHAHMLRGEGHVTLAAQLYGSILDDLLDLAGLPPDRPGNGSTSGLSAGAAVRTLRVAPGGGRRAGVPAARHGWACGWAKRTWPRPAAFRPGQHVAADHDGLAPGPGRLGPEVGPRLRVVGVPLGTPEGHPHRDADDGQDDQDGQRDVEPDERRHVFLR